MLSSFKEYEKFKEGIESFSETEDRIIDVNYKVSENLKVKISEIDKVLALPLKNDLNYYFLISSFKETYNPLENGIMQNTIVNEIVRYRGI